MGQSTWDPHTSLLLSSKLQRPLKAMSRSISDISDKQSVSSGSGTGRDVEQAQVSQIAGTAPPPFKWSSLWQAPVINPLNGKSQTIPIFHLKNQYTRNFHLSWLAFFVAFLSWFAFPPLVPEAIKEDLNLTKAELGNSNITALSATLGLRFVTGPLVDRYGPRYVMAALLILGAIPSGLAGTISNATGLYIIRFFIGILGATFVPCQAWTTLFFDKNVVGSANALVGGWGNLGGGVTFVVQVALFESLVNDRGLTKSQAWRTAFAVVPVPILLFVAALCLFFGTDCPAGKWSQRHTMPATLVAMQQGHNVVLDKNEYIVTEKADSKGNSNAATAVQAAETTDAADIDIATSEHLTWRTLGKMLATPQTWLCPLIYILSFGFELAVDANLASVFYASQNNADPNFGQLEAGYYAAIYGFMNICFRFFGGFFADLLLPRFGVRGKKYYAMALCFLQGCFCLGLGLYQRAQFNAGSHPDLGVQVGFIVLMAVFGFQANGAVFSLVPHLNSFNNGFMSGLTGGFGNLGGILFACIFRFNPSNAWSQAWIISGAFTIALAVSVVVIPLRKIK